MALTHKDATIVMGMLVRGDHNHDIAAWFGENPARIAEIKDGSAFGVVQAASQAELPPRGAVGPKARRLRAYANGALAVLLSRGADGVTDAVKELREGLTNFEQHEA
jgi:hypothetical protein